MSREKIKLRRILRLALVTVICACTAHPSPPTTVSQSEMNLDMLHRIKHDGAAQCGNAGGLKGVEWAYSTTAEGKLAALPPGAVRLSSALANPETVSDIMQDLADHAPQPYHHEVYSDPATEAATYICADGSEHDSANFVFVP